MTNFRRGTLATDEVTHDVYVGAENGPGVLLLHELPGLTTSTPEPDTAP